MVKTRSIGMVTSVVALVALGASATLGQAEPGGAPMDRQFAVQVTGTSTLVGQADAGTTRVDGAIVRVRGTVLLTLERSTDPRVDGRGTITVDYDAYPDESGRPGATQVRYGHMRLENDDGAWSGRFAGTLANGGFVQTYWLRGEGAYAGLSYVVTAAGNGNVWRIQGLIFPGDLPPLGGGPRLPLDGPGSELPVA